MKRFSVKENWIVELAMLVLGCAIYIGVLLALLHMRVS